jgi:hypothetical protein
MAYDDESRLSHFGVDHVLDERRVAEQDDPVEVRPELRQDTQDLTLVVARRDHRDRVALGREVPHTRGGEQAAHPGAQREAHHGEGAAYVLPR